MRVVASASGYRSSETMQSFTTLQEQLLVERFGSNSSRGSSECQLDDRRASIGICGDSA